MSGIKEAEELKAVMRPYIAFLMDKVNKIYDAWDEGDLELALSRACRLVTFLPRAIKEQLRGDEKTITKYMNAAYGLETGIWYTTQLIQNRRTRQIAQLFLEPFVDKMIDLLDERGYLEKIREFRKGMFEG